MTASQTTSRLHIRTLNGYDSLEAIVEALNAALYDRPLIHSVVDTSSIHPKQRTLYGALLRPAAVSLHPSQSIHVPTNTDCGISIYNEVLEHEGERYQPLVEVAGDMVSISCPFLYGEVGVRWRHHALLPLRSLDTESDPLTHIAP